MTVLLLSLGFVGALAGALWLGRSDAALRQLPESDDDALRSGAWLYLC